jgi:hypothetical protein
MADPFTIIAGIGLGLNIIGGLTKAEGQRQQGREAMRAAEINAARTEREGERRKRSILSSQAAGFAKGGVDITSGSPLLVMAQTEALADLEIKEGVSDILESGRRSKRAGDIAAGSTFLTTLGSSAVQAGSLGFFNKRT